MRKLASLSIAAVMVAAGLVAGTGTAATAGGPYAVVPTNTQVPVPQRVERGESLSLNVQIAASTNRFPRGRVTVRVFRFTNVTRAAERGTFYTETKRNRKGGVSFTTPDLRKLGKYRVVVRFKPKPDSRWKPSVERDTFRVVKG